LAASGTCLITGGKREAWLGTGGTAPCAFTTRRIAGARGRWSRHLYATTTPSSGIFSLAFSDAKHGIAVGGDYSKAPDTTGNIAVTVDGGPHLVGAGRSAA